MDRSSIEAGNGTASAFAKLPRLRASGHLRSGER